MRVTLSVCLTLWLWLGAASCTPSFDPASLVQSPRLIAVLSDPPEATPGTSVRLTPIVVTPTGALEPSEDGSAEGTFAASWWRCPDSDSDALGDFFVCTTPSERIDLGTSVPHVDAVPATVFGPLPDEGAPLPENTPPPEKYLGALLGYYRVMGVDIRVGGTRVVDGFKRTPIYLPFSLDNIDPALAALDTRLQEDGTLVQNTNPSITGVSIHEGSVDGPTVDSVTPGGKYFFVPVYDKRALQPYISLRVDVRGLDTTDPSSLQSLTVADLQSRVERVQRCEIPVFSWFINSGSVRRGTTQDEAVVQEVFDPLGIACPPIEGDIRTPDTEYTAPDGSEAQPFPSGDVVRGWVVLRDGRGGTAVRSFDLALNR
jgi:hypothetical protein